VTPAQAFLPLGSLARIEVADGMNQVSREDGKRRIVMQCNVRDRTWACLSPRPKPLWRGAVARGWLVRLERAI